MAINRFDGAYSFLSNFYEHPVEYNGITFTTNEAAFQAQKCPSRATEFIGITPGQAKRLGRRVVLVSNWESVKDTVMYELCKEKFKAGSELAARLLATGDTELIEGNTWGDRYWGQDTSGNGLNKLGEILMRVRRELR